MNGKIEQFFNSLAACVIEHVECEFLFVGLFANLFDTFYAHTRVLVRPTPLQNPLGMVRVGLGRVPHDIDELDFARALASRVSCAAKALETRLGVKSNHRLGECRSTYFYFVLLRDFLKV